MGAILGALLMQQQILRNSSYGAYRSEENETKKKKQYYELLNNKVMMIQITELHNYNQIEEEDIMINASMIKKVKRGFKELPPYNMDEWSTIIFFDDSEIKVKMSIDELQQTIWREQEILNK